MYRVISFLCAFLFAHAVLAQGVTVSHNQKTVATHNQNPLYGEYDVWMDTFEIEGAQGTPETTIEVALQYRRWILVVGGEETEDWQTCLVNISRQDWTNPMILDVSAGSLTTIVYSAKADPPPSTNNDLYDIVLNTHDDAGYTFRVVTRLYTIDGSENWAEKVRWHVPVVTPLPPPIDGNPSAG